MTNTSTSEAAKNPYSRAIVVGVTFTALLLVGQVVCFWLYANSTHFQLTRDLWSYTYQAESMLQGIPPIVICKPPGTGMWIALHRILFDGSAAGYVSFSCFAIGCLPALVYLVFGLLVNVRAGLCAGVFALLSPSCFNLSVMAETPAIMGTALAFVFLAFHQKRPHMLLLLGSALMLFFAYLCRSEVGGYAMGIILLLASNGTRSERAKRCAIFILILGLLFLGWSFSCLEQYGRLSPPKYEVASRFYNSFKSECDYRVDMEHAAIRQIVASLRKSNYVDPALPITYKTLCSSRSYIVARVALSIDLGSYVDADKVMSNACWHIWRYNIREYTIDRFSTFLSFVFFEKTDLRNALARLTGGALRKKKVRPEEVQRPYWSWAVENKDREYWRSRNFDVASPYFEITHEFYQKVKARKVWSRFHPNPVRRTYRRYERYMLLLVYLGIGLLFLTARQRAFLGYSLLASVFIIWLAYGYAGWYHYRYELSQGWAIWSLGGWGYWSALERGIRSLQRLRSTKT